MWIGFVRLYCHVKLDWVNNYNNINNNGKPFLRSQIPPGKYRKQIMVYNGPSFTVYKGGTTPIEITSGTKLGWNGKSWQVPNEGVVMNPKTGVTMFFNGEKWVTSTPAWGGAKQYYWTTDEARKPRTRVSGNRLNKAGSWLNNITLNKLEHIQHTINYSYKNKCIQKQAYLTKCAKLKLAIKYVIRCNSIAKSAGITNSNLTQFVVNRILQPEYMSKSADMDQVYMDATNSNNSNSKPPVDLSGWWPGNWFKDTRTPEQKKHDADSQAWRETEAIKRDPRNQAYNVGKPDKVNVQRLYSTPAEQGSPMYFAPPTSQGTGNYGPFPTKHVPIFKSKLIPGATSYKKLEPENPGFQKQIRDLNQKWVDELKSKGSKPGASSLDKENYNFAQQNIAEGEAFRDASERAIGESLGKQTFKGVDPNNLPISSQMYTDPRAVENAMLDYFTDRAVAQIIDERIQSRLTPQEREVPSPAVAQQIEQARAKAFPIVRNMLMHPTKEQVQAMDQRLQNGTATPIDYAMRDSMGWFYKSNKIGKDPVLMGVYSKLQNKDITNALASEMANNGGAISQTYYASDPEGFERFRNAVYDLLDAASYDYKTVGEIGDQLATFDANGNYSGSASYDNNGVINANGIELRKLGYTIPDFNPFNPAISTVVQKPGGGITIEPIDPAKLNDLKKNYEKLYPGSTFNDKYTITPEDLQNAQNILGFTAFKDDADSRATYGEDALGYSEKDFRDKTGKTWAYKQISDSMGPEILGMTAGAAGLAIQQLARKSAIASAATSGTPIRTTLLGEGIRGGTAFGVPYAIGDYAGTKWSESSWVPKVRKAIATQAIAYPLSKRYVVSAGDNPFSPPPTPPGDLPPITSDYFDDSSSSGYGTLKLPPTSSSSVTPLPPPPPPPSEEDYFSSGVYDPTAPPTSL